MNKLLEQLKKHLMSVKMTASEHSRIKDAVSSYMENWKEEPKETPYFKITLGYFSRRVVQVVAVALIFMLTLGTGLAHASQESLPGEILYPVKITTEDITSFFTTSTEKKIDWEIERTERRMEEALKLAIRQKLDDHIQEELSKKIQQHTKTITEEIKKIEEENPTEALSAHADLETSIDAHNEILLQIKDGAGQDEITEKNIDKIIEVTTNESKKALESKEKNEEQVVAEDNEVQTTEDKIETTKIKLDKIKILQDKIKALEEKIKLSLPKIEIIIEEVPAIEEKITEDVTENEEGSKGEEPQLLEATPENNLLEKATGIPEPEETIIEAGGDDIVMEETGIIEEPVVEMEPVANKTVVKLDIEALKKQAEEHVQKEEYGKAIVILEEIYQYLSKQIIVEKITKEVVDPEQKTESENTIDEAREEDIIKEENNIKQNQETNKEEFPTEEQKQNIPEESLESLRTVS